MGQIRETQPGFEAFLETGGVNSKGAAADIGQGGMTRPGDGLLALESGVVGRSSGAARGRGGPHHASVRVHAALDINAYLGGSILVRLGAAMGQEGRAWSRSTLVLAFGEQQCTTARKRPSLSGSGNQLITLAAANLVRLGAAMGQEGRAWSGSALGGSREQEFIENATPPTPQS